MLSAIDRWKRNSKERLKDLPRRLESFSGRFGIWSFEARNKPVGFASCGAWHETLRLQRARQLGVSQLDLGGTPPFLDDGVFNYKMRWNARLNTERRIWGTHHLLLDPGNAAVQAFFQRHSMLVYDSENRLCVCSGKRPWELKITSGILDELSGWWRLASPQEAKDRGLDKEPSNGMPSGWFVQEPLDGQ